MARFSKYRDMSTFIITKKSGMTRLFTEEGTVQPVTVLSVVPSEVARTKTAEKDGYVAGVVKGGKVVRECRADEVSCDLATLNPGVAVNLKGVTKGKGFAGTIKRHGFKRGPSAHGSKNVRKPGSIGSGYPERVQKGLKMAGRMGGENMTMKTSVVSVNAAEGLVLVKGSVPGSRGSLITLQTL